MTEMYCMDLEVIAERRKGNDFPLNHTDLAGILDEPYVRMRLCNNFSTALFYGTIEYLVPSTAYMVLHMALYRRRVESIGAASEHEAAIETYPRVNWLY